MSLKKGDCMDRDCTLDGDNKHDHLEDNSDDGNENEPCVRIRSDEASVAREEKEEEKRKKKKPPDKGDAVHDSMEGYAGTARREAALMMASSMEGYAGTARREATLMMASSMEGYAGTARREAALMMASSAPQITGTQRDSCFPYSLFSLLCCIASGIPSTETYNANLSRFRRLFNSTAGLKINFLIGFGSLDLYLIGEIRRNTCNLTVVTKARLASSFEDFLSAGRRRFTRAVMIAAGERRIRLATTMTTLNLTDLASLPRLPAHALSTPTDLLESSAQSFPSMRGIVCRALVLMNRACPLVCEGSVLFRCRPTSVLQGFAEQQRNLQARLCQKSSGNSIQSGNSNANSRKIFSSAKSRTKPQELPPRVRAVAHDEAHECLYVAQPARPLSLPRRSLQSRAATGKEDKKVAERCPNRKSTAMGGYSRERASDTEYLNAASQPPLLAENRRMTLENTPISMQITGMALESDLKYDTPHRATETTNTNSLMKFPTLCTEDANCECYEESSHGQATDIWYSHEAACNRPVMESIWKYPTQCAEDVCGSASFSSGTNNWTGQGEMDRQRITGMTVSGPIQCEEDQLYTQSVAGAHPDGLPAAGHEGDGASWQRGAHPRMVMHMPRFVVVAQCEEDAKAEIIRQKRAENHRLRTRLLCQMCALFRWNVVLDPCGHLLCKHCYQEQTVCPFCLREVRLTIPVLLAE